ncbi:MAG: Fe-S cluster assembly protein SufD [Acidobacteriota bacterium]
MDHQTTQFYRSERERFERNGASGSPEWLKRLRSTAFHAFAEQGFPSAEREEWRFTNIAPIAKEQFAYAPKRASSLTEADASRYRITDSEHRFTFVNGHFSNELSLNTTVKGARVFPLAGASTEELALVQEHLAKHADVKGNPFAALNTAFIADGLFVQMPAGVSLEAPIHILHLSAGAEDGSPSASYPRVIVAAGEGSSAAVIETFAGPAAAGCFTNAVTEMLLQPDAHLQYVKLQEEHEASYHMHAVSVEQQTRSVLNMFSLALGGAIARSEYSVILEGEKADCNLNGLYFADGSRLTDHHTFIHHKVPECTSHELFKGILDGHARGVYSGKVYVDAIAQKTDSKQTNRNLMLSETATIDTKPQLEIFADDVKCTHGAAVGGLSEKEIFYLKSRGIGGTTARGIATVGFAAEATEKITHEPSRRRVDACVVDMLQKRLGATVQEIVHSETTHEEDKR